MIFVIERFSSPDAPEAMGQVMVKPNKKNINWRLMPKHKMLGGERIASQWS